MYKTILAPLDGSKRAEKILPHVEALAQKFGATLVLMQVVDPAVTEAAPYDIVPNYDPEQAARLMDEAKAYLNKLKEQLHQHSFVTFSDPVPYEELNDLLCSADVHFLFQKNEVVDTVMPSKILAMMASAKPSIITGNKSSEVASIINQSEGGFYISDDKVQTVYEKLLELKANPSLCEQTKSILCAQHAQMLPLSMCNAHAYFTRLCAYV